MVYNLLLNGVYWGYNPLTNHLLISWDIQVEILHVKRMVHMFLQVGLDLWLWTGGWKKNIFPKWWVKNGDKSHGRKDKESPKKTNTPKKKNILPLKFRNAKKQIRKKNIHPTHPTQKKTKTYTLED